MARFFIDRPIFAWVVAIVIMLAGVISILSLPIAQYPSIAPPSISISGSYPGASAKTVEDAVTQVIEQKMKGIDGLRYMASSSDATGGISITLTFTSGTNPDIAQVQVQNKLQLATPLLPTAVTQQGLVVSKATKNFLMVFGFISENGKMDQTDLSDYVAANVVDPLSRVPGVGSIQVFGGKYAMRIWLDPTKLQTYKVSVDEVTASVKAQNAQVAVGQLGGAPAVKGQQLNATINAQDRLQTPEQFRNIVLRTETDGSTLKLGDVARVELGAETYDFVTRYNGKPASGLAITLATGANALET
ncbi:MAG: efflux RND transporter permease subunit, partial [Janthinobacterium sp.]